MSSEALTWAFNLDGNEHGLTHGQKSVLIAIANYADEEGSAYPGLRRLARMTGMSERGVRYSLRELEARGFVHTVEQFRSNGDRGQTSNRYYLSRTPGATTAPGSTVPLRGAATTAGGEAPGAGGGLQSVPQGGAKSAAQDTKKTHTPSNEGASGAATRGEIEPSPEFVAFWDGYGKKVKRPDALNAWRKAVKKAPAEEIIAAAVAFRATYERLGKLDFMPHPATWLNAEQWNDDLPATRPSSAGGPTVGQPPLSVADRWAGVRRLDDD